MTNTKRRDPKPELELRSALHALGLRFFVDRPIPGSRRRSDVVFPTERVAVYVDGCFWHSCPQHGTVPKQNRQWWVDKLAANKRRDDDTDAALCAEGWLVLRFWEHDDPITAAGRVRDAVFERRRGLVVTGAQEQMMPIALAVLGGEVEAHPRGWLAPRYRGSGTS
jgi:DNA mismatch endonuclease (patch repair protein)